MAMPDYESVDAYIAAQSEIARPMLTRMRNLIRKAAPEVVESISYKVPTYKLQGKPLVFFAAWKEHLSLYPATSAVFAEVPDLLPFKHAKDTVRLRYDAALPVHLVAAFAKARAREVATQISEALEPAPKPGATRKIVAKKKTARPKPK